MKRVILLLIICLLLSCIGGCATPQDGGIAATTLPVYEFTMRLCQGTGIPVTCLVTENVSCLHDYTLQVSQMKELESADAIVITGAGLEDFMTDILQNASCVINASTNVDLIDIGHSHDYNEAHGQEHHHQEDPHIWLSPDAAMQMSQNICDELTVLYPQHKNQFNRNLNGLLCDLQELRQYGHTQLQNLKFRDLITFHDGFSYLARDFQLNILEAVEEESGSEASAQELISLITLVNEHHLPAVFTETYGSTSAARIIAAETGTAIYTLDMAMSGSSYFEAMYHNINTLKEALG
ncbi:MAG: zinc ABC transporter substrate-binding protein [Oscillospiraceae bacterium]|nr:zinc ABC transporter substrate-binding protein [Oscillospiraceae bacterium]